MTEMAAFAAVFHMAPADYWGLRVDERNALVVQLKAIQKGQGR